MSRKQKLCALPAGLGGEGGAPSPKRFVLTVRKRHHNLEMPLPFNTTSCWPVNHCWSWTGTMPERLPGATGHDITAPGTPAEDSWASQCSFAAPSPRPSSPRAPEPERVLVRPARAVSVAHVFVGSGPLTGSGGACVSRLITPFLRLYSKTMLS